MIGLGVVLLVATLVGGFLVIESLRRSVDDAYASGWRDGYDLGYVHGSNRQPYQRETHVPEAH